MQWIGEEQLVADEPDVPRPSNLDAGHGRTVPRIVVPHFSFVIVFMTCQLIVSLKCLFHDDSRRTIEAAGESRRRPGHEETAPKGSMSDNGQELYMSTQRSTTAQGPAEPPLLLTLADLTRLTRLSRTTLYKAIRCGELPVIHVGRAVRVRRVDLLRWLETQAA
jgi:excisionase family DNA binding protein